MNKALPARATAKIAPWVDALKAGHAAGWTWAELAERLPADLGMSVKQIAQSVMRCKYSVPQVQLPGLHQNQQPQPPKGDDISKDKNDGQSPTTLSYAERLAQAKANKVNTDSLFVTSK